MAHLPDHYAVLELPVTASEQDVRRAYRRLAVRWHPDKNQNDVSLAEVRFKEVSEAYEILRDPVKRRQYDRSRARREAPSASWFSDSSDSGFGDDLWEDNAPGWGDRRPGWAFRNPFDVFREFFGESDPWADFTPLSQRRQESGQTRNGDRGSRFWSSMDNDPFFSSRTPFFSSPFFGRAGSLFDQINRGPDEQSRRGRSPQTITRETPPRPTGGESRVTEIRIHSFTDSEDDSEEEEIVIEDEPASNEAAEAEDDAELREAIRLSLLQQESERKRELEQSEQDLAEAIRLSLAEQANETAAQDRMEIDNQAH